MKKQTLPRQSAHIVDLLTIMYKNVSKIPEKKKRKLVLLVLHQTKVLIVQLGNALDADPKIILSKNVPSHLKTARKDASLTNLRKNVIVRKTTATMTMTLKYTHIWHECLMMRRSSSRTIFLFFFSDLFETLFHKMVRKSTICALCLGRVCFLIVFTRP